MGARNRRKEEGVREKETEGRGRAGRDGEEGERKREGVEMAVRARCGRQYSGLSPPVQARRPLRLSRERCFRCGVHEIFFSDADL